MRRIAILASTLDCADPKDCENRSASPTGPAPLTLTPTLDPGPATGYQWEPILGKQNYPVEADKTVPKLPSISIFNKQNPPFR